MSKLLANTITLDANLLRACATIAPKQDVRYYLVGVYLHWDGRDTLTYVATDGHVLTAFRETIPSDDRAAMGDTWEMIIPREVAAKPAAKNLSRIPLTPSGTRYALGGLKGPDMVFDPIDGRFPDWRRVIPMGEPTGETAQFNPDLLAAAMNALRIGNDCAKQLWDLEHNGNGPGRIVTPTGIAIIMPYRTSGAVPIDNDMRGWIQVYPVAETEAMAA